MDNTQSIEYVRCMPAPILIQPEDSKDSLERVGSEEMAGWCADSDCGVSGDQAGIVLDDDNDDVDKGCVMVKQEPDFMMGNQPEQLYEDLPVSVPPAMKTELDELPPQRWFVSEETATVESIAEPEITDEMKIQEGPTVVQPVNLTQNTSIDPNSMDVVQIDKGYFCIVCREVLTLAKNCEMHVKTYCGKEMSKKIAKLNMPCSLVNGSPSCADCGGGFYGHYLYNITSPRFVRRVIQSNGSTDFFALINQEEEQRLMRTCTYKMIECEECTEYFYNKHFLKLHEEFCRKRKPQRHSTNVVGKPSKTQIKGVKAVKTPTKSPIKLGTSKKAVSKPSKSPIKPGTSKKVAGKPTKSPIKPGTSMNVISKPSQPPIISGTSTPSKPFNSLVCPNCDKSFTSQNGFRMHKNICSKLKVPAAKKPVDTYKCIQCMSDFPNKHELNTHQKICSFSFQCKKCDEYIHDINIFMRHKDICTGKGTVCMDLHKGAFGYGFQCKKCGNVLNNMQLFLKHTMDCLLPPKSDDKDKEEQNSHLPKKGKKRKRSTKRSIPDDSIRCEKCDKSFPKKDKLLKHMAVCTGKSSSEHTDDNILLHLLKNQKEDLLKCKICKQEFVNKEELCAHVSSCVLQYRCEICLQDFGKNVKDYLDHMKMHANEPKVKGYNLRRKGDARQTQTPDETNFNMDCSRSLLEYVEKSQAHKDDFSETSSSKDMSHTKIFDGEANSLLRTPTCNRCWKSFCNQEQLAAHLEDCPFTLQCKYCENYFKDVRFFMNHVKKCGKAREGVPSRKEQDKHMIASKQLVSIIGQIQQSSPLVADLHESGQTDKDISEPDIKVESVDSPLVIQSVFSQADVPSLIESGQDVKDIVKSEEMDFSLSSNVMSIKQEPIEYQDEPKVVYTMKCDQCNDRFLDVEALSRHIAVCPYTYQCKYCHVYFKDLDLFLNHGNRCQQSISSDYPNTECSIKPKEELDVLSQYTNYMADDGHVENYLCKKEPFDTMDNAMSMQADESTSYTKSTLNDQSYSNSYSYDNQCLTNDPKFECKHCNGQFATVNVFMAHGKECVGLKYRKGLLPQGPEENTPTVAPLRTEPKVESAAVYDGSDDQDDLFSCLYCRQDYNMNFMEYIDHVKICIKPDNTKPLGTDELHFQCKCHAVFKEVTPFWKHYEICFLGGLKSPRFTYNCSYCDATFRTKIARQAHARYCCKVFECPLCQVKVSEGCKYASHVQECRIDVLSRDKMIDCTNCSEFTINYEPVAPLDFVNEYMSHIRDCVSDGTLVTCPLCRAKFHNYRGYNFHLRKCFCIT